MPLYDAFISYSHAKDKPIAAALQSVMQKLGKPWHRRRALRIFRDDTSLSATPHLWPSIEKALSESRYLILLASPEAARSPWVAKEIAYWLEHKSPDTLFIGLTEGALAWDGKNGDFKWTAKTPLPKALKGRFTTEPKWVDFRSYRDGGDPSDAHFIERGADFAAAIRGMPKEDLLSQELRQQRRALTLAMGAAASLLVLAVAAGWQWRTAEGERTLKTEQLRQAQINESQYLAARARQAAESGNPELAKTLMTLALPTNFQSSDRPVAPSAASAIAAVISQDPIESILLGHTGRINGLSFSPDGTMLVTASEDGTARVWNAATGETLRRLSGHESSLYSAVFSKDGKRILTTSSDMTARIWDAATGAEIRVFKDVMSAVFSADETLVLTVTTDYTARILDAATGELRSELVGHTGSVKGAEFSADGKHVITVSNAKAPFSQSDGTVRLWDATTGAQIKLLDQDPEPDLSRNVARFSPDGARLFAASARGDAIIFDAATGVELSVLKGGDNRIYDGDFSPDGERVVTSSREDVVTLWDVATGRPIRTAKGGSDDIRPIFSPDGQRILVTTASYEARDPVMQLMAAASGETLQIVRFSNYTSLTATPAFSRDGNFLAAGFDDGTVYVLRTDTAIPERVLAGDGKMESVAFSPDGKRILAGADDSVAMFATTGQRLYTLPDTWGEAAFSPDGSRVLTLQPDARIWDSANGKLLATLKDDEVVDFARFSPDGRQVLLMFYKKPPILWDTVSGERLPTLDYMAKIADAAFSPDGTRLLTVSWDGTGRIWDAATGYQLHALEGETNYLLAGSFNHAGTLVATAGVGRTTRLWDATTGKLLRLLPGDETIESVAFSPDDSLLVTSYNDGTAVIWDTRSGERLGELKGHEFGEMRKVAFSPDGGSVLTVSKKDGTARLWDAATGTAIAILSGYDTGSDEGRNGPLSEIKDAAFSPAGDDVVVVSNQKKIRIWRVPRNLEAAAGYLRASISRRLRWNEREDIGLELPPAPKAESCDAAAADPFDPQSGGIGVTWAEIKDEAFPLCEEAVSRNSTDAKRLYQLARAQHRANDSNWGWIASAWKFADNFRAAAESGYPMALFAVAGLKDTPPDEAMKLLLRAHEQGVILAAKSIAQHYAEGSGVAKDPGKALEWLRLGVQQGDPWANVELGRVYWEGDADYGVTPDRERALFHFISALKIFDDRGYGNSFEIDPAMLYRANVARQLPMQKVAEIAELAQSWKPGDPLPAFGATSPEKPQAPQVGAALQ